jgi:hypothetical protein
MRVEDGYPHAGGGDLDVLCAEYFLGFPDYAENKKQLMKSLEKNKDVEIKQEWDFLFNDPLIVSSSIPPKAAEHQGVTLIE